MVLNKQNIVLGVKSSLQSHHRFKTGLWTHKKTSVLQNDIISVVFIVCCFSISMSGHMIYKCFSELFSHASQKDILCMNSCE